MKKSLLFCLTILAFQPLFSQNNKTMPPYNKDKYEQQWKRIDSLENEGLPQSALAEVTQLHERAKRDNNPTQLVKTLIYREKYQSQLEEDGDVKSIGRLQTEIGQADFPVKPILQSLLAEMYRRYAEQNSWKFRERTTVAEQNPADISTWSLEQLLNESSRLYLASLQYDMLDEVPLAELQAITQEGKNTEGLWTTLYDLLAHRALEHFTNETSYLTEPVYEFNINDSQAFEEASRFVQLKFTTKDTTSFKYQALLLYQKVLQYHLQDKDPKALIDVDLQRLKFVRNTAVLPNKDELYEKSLQTLLNRYKKHPSAAEIIYEIAYLRYEEGLKYDINNPETEKYRLQYKAAKALLDDIIKNYPKTYGAKQAESLRGQILQKALMANVEHINLPSQAILAKIDFRNVSKAFFNIVKLNDNDLKTFEKAGYDTGKRIELFKKLKPVKTWTQNLPDDGDFQNHSVEIIINALPLGHYALLVSDNQQFKSEGGAVGYLLYQVSNLAYLQKQYEAGNHEFVVVHRNSGEPLEGVQVEIFKTTYDYSDGQSERKRQSLGKFNSDRDGFVRPKIPQNIQYEIELRKGDDRLLPENNYYTGTYFNEPRSEQFTYFFTDRNIYRPGQTIYFKALAIERMADGMPRILPNDKVVVTLMDANGQKVSELELITNAYGTANGTFKAPEAGLLGQMSLMASIGGNQQYFRVEEYKRPKFEVVMQPLDMGYALGDSVTVKGTAKAYAGSNVDNATVRYRVVREVSFPWEPWWMWRGGGYPGVVETMEIANGEITTDVNGNFNITFPAVPDLSIDKKRNPLFSFHIIADVIDITGETHTGEKYVNLSELTLQANIEFPNSVDRQKAPLLKIYTTNLEGQPTPAQGTVTIQQLKTPDRTFIERYWEKPDRFVLTQAQFYQAFPHLAFKNENEPQNWAKANNVYTTEFNTAVIDSVFFNMNNWEVGHYEISLKTQDKNGKPIELKQIFTLYDAAEKRIPAHTLQWNQPEKTTYQPGEQANFYFATTEDHLNLLFETNSRARKSGARWLRINNWETVNYDVQEGDRGGMEYRAAFVKYNRFQAFNQMIQIPWSNKELSIEYGTFRDKLLPGAEEEWRIKISGSEKERVAAEVVATMYDASLDALAGTHTWNMSIYPYFYSDWQTWNSDVFTYRTLEIRALKWQPKTENVYRVYPSLNTFGMYFGGVYGREMLQVSMTARSAVATGGAPPPPAPVAEQALAYDSAAMNETVVTGNGTKSKKADTSENEEAAEQTPQIPQPVRTNLKETVFFMPEVKTDAEGNIILKFKMNEALTRWKFLAFAHTTDLKIATSQKEVVTQKDLMVLPNAPRFVREGDVIEFTAKVSNLSAQKLSGTARLQLFDALTNQPVDNLLANNNSTLNFVAETGQSAPLSWKLTVPQGKIQVLTYRVTVQAGNFSDGEESTIPVLTNRMLVTETMPISIRGGQNKTFNFTNLANASNSKTLQHQQLALEFTSNPAWYAVQALPYLMEFPYECTEQIFNRYYANALATSIANRYPKVRNVFESWKNTDALASNLSKNQELKTELLEETPWVLAAQSEAQQKQNIGLLFDLVRMSEERLVNLTKLAERQYESGAFPWFSGGPDNWYITQYILEGIGHLDHLGVEELSKDQNAMQIAQKGIGYIDNQVKRHYAELELQVKNEQTKWEDDHLDNIIIHYLYTRSFFNQYQPDADLQKIINYYLSQAEKHWLKKGFYEQGLLAMALLENDRRPAAEKIVKSLSERALRSEELGMYWKYNNGWWWHQMPIETHALMIEVFSSLSNDPKTIDELRLWLLKNKQTNNWETTKATAAAVYALLINEDNWLMEANPVQITFPNVKKNVYQDEIAVAQRSAEAGTGYFKMAWDATNPLNDYSEVKVKNPNKNAAWGSMYWQYFEDLDKIKS
ncbi:MAG: alpha-2-macroglobulin family protein, partial [Saprospiraceae bacterium]